jgi:hypothetical protein
MIDAAVLSSNARAAEAPAPRRDFGLTDGRDGFIGPWRRPRRMKSRKRLLSLITLAK